MSSLYDRLNPQNLEILVHRFYDLVFTSEIIAPLFMNSSKEEVIRKQKLFLTQFLGGPGIYSLEFGHPKMRMRHLPHKITNEAKEEWLKCMKGAINELSIDETLKQELYNCFPHVAAHMVNV